MEIKLTPAQSKLVSRLLKSGHFATSRDVVAAGLRVLAREGKRQRRTEQDTKAKIAAGLRDIEQGRVISGEKFFDEFSRLTDAFLKRPKRGK